MRRQKTKSKMASSAVPYPTWKGITVVLLLLSLSFTPSKSEGSSPPSHNSEEFSGKKSVLGSRPPACINKCSSCRPCMATLVIPPRHERHFMLSQADDSTYYLLFWKCRCGNRLFQP